MMNLNHGMPLGDAAVDFPKYLPEFVVISRIEEDVASGTVELQFFENINSYVMDVTDKLHIPV